MGNLLGSPVTEKETHKGEVADLKFGVSSMQGWRVHMEDAHIMESNLYVYNLSSKDNNKDNNNNSTKFPEGHALFAVFDGHGGTFAAEYCGANFCRIFSKQPGVAEYLEKLNESGKAEFSNNAVEKLKAIQNCKAPLEQALQQAFLELDQELALMIQGNPVRDANMPYHTTIDASSQNQQSSSASTTTTSTTTTSTTTTDDDMLQAASAAAAQHAQVLSDGGDDSGTTACMVLVTPQWLICANAGDSRAVFSKQQRAVPLSYDHKPDDEEEERRIRAAGGYVAGGRVEGDLAVSRGLGDFRFKTVSTVLEASASNAGLQKVSPIPDLIVQTRNAEQDDFLIIACDGVWDVMTNQECVSEVMQLLKEGETDMGLLCEELLDECLAKGSKDNMTAIVVAFPPAMKLATESKAAVTGTAAGEGAAAAEEPLCGVLARRKRRDDAHNENNNSNTTEEESGGDEDDEEAAAAPAAAATDAPAEAKTLAGDGAAMETS